MNSVKRLALILAATGALLTTASADMPRNAFLNKRVSTVNQLIQQFKDDPVVQQRYMRHYGATKEDIIRFFSTFKAGKLAETGYYKVYNVDKLYVVRSKLQKLKVGTSVFYTPGGEVAMLVSCGNATDIKIVAPRYLLENPVVPIDVVTPPDYMPFIPGLPEEICTPEAIFPPTVTEVEEREKEIIVERRRRSWFPIPIPIPLIRTRHKECPPCDVIPGPAAAISFGLMAAVNRRRRKTK